MILAELTGRLQIGAASGLVVTAGGLVCVIGDDEHSLAVHERTPAGVVLARRVRLFEGELPVEPEARKALKPDLEALALLPDGSLLALGSGSTPRRRRGAHVPPAALAGLSLAGPPLAGPPLAGLPLAGPPLAAPPLASAAVRTVDLAPLYAALVGTFAELNVEGAAVTGGTLRLLQRGNGPAGQNGVIDLDLDGVLAALTTNRPFDATLIRNVHTVNLGTIDGVRLGFTDASPLGPGALVFTASAEASPDTYRDGPVAGSVVGVLSPAGDVLWMDRVTVIGATAPAKLEGIHATWTHDTPGGRMRDPTGTRDVDLLLVADADVAALPAELLSARIASSALPPAR